MNREVGTSRSTFTFDQSLIDQNLWNRRQAVCTLGRALPLTSLVTLDKSLNSFAAHFPQLWNEGFKLDKIWIAFHF